ncbi:MAG: DUF6498-containing protein [Pseudomonadales bacterium]|nr:hypothetical protein [Pseudomonadales bacterium]
MSESKPTPVMSWPASLAEIPVPRAVSLAALVIVNLIPLAGVLYWDWDVGSVVILYWSENLVIGAYTILKMLVENRFGGLFLSAFFLIHYGGFCAVHGLFVLAMTQPEMPDVLSDMNWPFVFVFVELLVKVIGHVLSIAPQEWLIGFVALFVSHGISLWLNYFRGGEFRRQSVKDLMSAPYKRIVVLHIAIIAGGFGIMALGSPLALLLLLILLKTVMDVWLHLRERRRQAPASVAAAG